MGGSIFSRDDYDARSVRDNRRSPAQAKGSSSARQTAKRQKLVRNTGACSMATQ